MGCSSLELVGGVVVGPWFDCQRYIETQLGDLRGDGLDIYAVDAVLDQLQVAPVMGLAAARKGIAGFFQFGVAGRLVADVEGGGVAPGLL